MLFLIHFEVLFLIVLNKRGLITVVCAYKISPLLMNLEIKSLLWIIQTHFLSFEFKKF